MTRAAIISCRRLLPRTREFEYTGAGLDLDITAGEIVSLIGPDYSGKSKWLRVLGGVTPPRMGELKLLQKDTEAMDRRDWGRVRMQLGYVRSDTSVLSAANALQNVVLAARYHQLGPTPVLTAKAASLLNELGIDDHTSLPAYLRDDQRYMIAVARALMLEPVALLLDNPFEKLDALATDRFQAYLLERARQQDMAIVLITHDIGFVVEHSDQILFITQDGYARFDRDNDIRACQSSHIRSFLNNNQVTC